MKLLDLFCGAGGAGEGYRLAGFEVTGVDIKPQPRYKPGRFIQADALEYAAAHGHEYDVIHASPPCQAYSVATNSWNSHGRAAHPELVEPTRDLLTATGKPFVIENVIGAPLVDPVMLCGTMFDLMTFRHRLFESNKFMMPPAHANHRAFGKAGPQGRKPKPGQYIVITGNFSGVDYARRAIGIDWMTRDELSQAIPPAYTEWIGRQLMKHLEARR